MACNGVACNGVTCNGVACDGVEWYGAHLGRLVSMRIGRSS